MSITVRMIRSWSFDQDPRGAARITYPKEWLGAVDDDLALVGIASGHAEPVNPLSADQQQRLTAIRRGLAGEIPIEEALASPVGAG